MTKLIFTVTTLVLLTVALGFSLNEASFYTGDDLWQLNSWSFN
jgi:hypothetical protein